MVGAVFIGAEQTFIAIIVAPAEEIILGGKCANRGVQNELNGTGLKAGQSGRPFRRCTKLCHLTEKLTLHH